MDDRDLLWKQLELHVGLYKHYLELVVKMSAFFYAVTGAIVSFYFARGGGPLLRWALVLPLCMSLGLALFLLAGAFLIHPVREEIRRVRDALRLGVMPELHVLTGMLLIFGVLYLITAAGLLVLLVCGLTWPVRS